MSRLERLTGSCVLMVAAADLGSTLDPLHAVVTFCCCSAVVLAFAALVEGCKRIP